MAVDWPREEIVAASRTHLLRPGAVAEGYAGVEVVEEAEAMLVVFRWRRDPNVYALEVDYPTVPESPMTGEPVDSAEEWAQDLEMHLAEELGTGLVHRARRTLREGHVLLESDDAPDAPAAGPPGFYIGSVPFDDPDLRQRPAGRRQFEYVRLEASALLRAGWNRLLGRGRYFTSITLSAESSGLSETEYWPTEPAMNDTIPRRLLGRGRLACWVQAYSINSDMLVGQAAASWEDDEHDVARIELLYTLPAIPSEVRYALARHVIVAAAEVGALRVVTSVDDPVLRRLGFRPSSTGDFAVQTTHE
ncbi:hypothetical protein ACWDWO_21010 [Actinopolymorpha singaporensis]